MRREAGFAPHSILRRAAAGRSGGTGESRAAPKEDEAMTETARFKVQRREATDVKRTPEELAELRKVRSQFQRDKPTLEQVLATTGQAEASTLGDYLQTRELLHALGQERQRQKLTLATLAQRTGYDPAVLSRLLAGRQANPTLATVSRIANALGKTVIYMLRDLASPAAADRPARPKAAASRRKGRTRSRAPSRGANRS
jgi:transcriptional regulator with XRE-family HTH domain